MADIKIIVQKSDKRRFKADVPDGFKINKKAPLISEAWYKILAATYSPTKTAVPLALVGLTSLFGMGRGEHHCYSHHNIFNIVLF